MADTTTTNYGYTKPEPNASDDTWGTKLNTNWDDLDTDLKAVSDAAAAAQTTATTGVTNAATAQSAADAAQATANTAVTNAATAQSTADTAVTNAATAQSTANAAQTTANAALPKAGGTITGDINVNGQDLWGVLRVGFGAPVDATGDYLQWSSGVGLLGYENGTLCLRAGVAGFIVPSMYNDTTASGANTYMSTGGQLFRSTSRGEFKVNRVDVAAMPEVVKKRRKDLTPFSFESTHDVDQGRRFIGFDAVDVAAAFPEAGVYDDEGNVINYDVRALVAILWNENEEREAEIAALRARVEALESA